MNLQEQVTTELQKVIDSGFVESCIQSNLEKTISGIISDSLREYSDFGRELRDLIEAKMSLSLEQIDVPEYATIVGKYIEEALLHCADNSVQQLILPQVKELFGLLEKTDWKLSEIIEQYTELLSSDEDKAGEIYLECRQEYGSWWISFGTQKGNYYSDYKYRFGADVKTGQIFFFTINDKKVDLTQDTHKNSISLFLLKLYAQRCRIIAIDENDCDLSYGNEYD